MVKKKDEIDFLLIYKILLKEKKVIFLVALLFAFVSGLYNLNKENQYKIDLSIDLANYPSLEVKCRASSAENMLICEPSNLQTSLYVYSKEVIDRFKEELKPLRKEYSSDLINISFHDEKNLDVSIISNSKNNIEEINSYIINMLDHLENSFFSEIKKYREHQSMLLKTNIEFLKKEIEFVEIINLEKNLEINTQSLISISNKLNLLDIENDMESYDALFSRYNSITSANLNNYNILENSRINAENIKPLQISYEKTLNSINSFKKSKIINEPKITIHKNKSIRNILISLLAGFFLSIFIILARNSKKF